MYGSPESRAEYHRVVREAEAAAARPAVAPPPDVSVNELLVAFKLFAEGYYVKGGRPTTEVREYGYAARAVRELYGHLPIARFDALALAAVRDRMVAAGWCRTRVNKQVGRVKRLFRWGVTRKLVPAAVLAELDALDGLKAGRTTARETPPVGPVADADVEAVLPHVRPPVRVMIRLQRLTGMRPAEVCGLTLGRVDRTGAVWVYRPAGHKTAHRGRDRAVYIGPRGQAVLAEFLGGREQAPDEPVFSPVRDQEERQAELRRSRRTNVPPSQRGHRKPAPRRSPGLAYLPTSYAHAVRAGCERAGVPGWSPNQLRHAHATEVRRGFGLEAAQVALGHAKADVTQVYAERDGALAARVAGEIG